MHVPFTSDHNYSSLNVYIVVCGVFCNPFTSIRTSASILQPLPDHIQDCVSALPACTVTIASYYMKKPVCPTHLYVAPRRRTNFNMVSLPQCACTELIKVRYSYTYVQVALRSQPKPFRVTRQMIESAASLWGFDSGNICSPTKMDPRIFFFNVRSLEVISAMY